MDVTAQDILDLTASFEKLQANRDLGDNYRLNKE